ncbi:cathepsin L [Brachionus plicatilis]|uniref:Cathepsin L n=1 Tax=Brachionus plicatilis TaxID=10195 RepID=A0A3M7RPC7_BRAPC|nr:cathepsin L [Brachionus plicatilis]
MYLISVAILLFVIHTSLALTAQQLATKWNGFKLSNKRRYSNRLDEALRFQIFKSNLEFIEKHNARADIGEVSYRLAVNQFADMTSHEFSILENGFDHGLFWPSQKSEVFPHNASHKNPSSVDWRGLTTPIKDQGKCGSCWAFATTGVIEALNARKTGLIVPLSEQQLIDCSIPFGNNGCNGGYMNNAFRYIVQNNGLNSEKVYSYSANTGRCRYRSNDKSKIQISSFARIPQGDEQALEQAVAIVGPISIAIDASLPTFQFYSSGIYSDTECKNKFKSLNHAVVLVGYGLEGNNSYWLIRNSWGSNWGTQGYMRIAKGNDNLCGVATESSYPIL